MTKLSHFLYEQTGSDSRLIIQSGLNRRQLKGVDLKTIKNSPGYILKETSIEIWNIESTQESDSGMCFVGPYIKGRSLSSVTKFDKSLMDHLLRVFRLFEGDDWEFRLVSPESIYLCDNGDILVFPPALMSFLLGTLSDSDKTKIVNPYTHPALEGGDLYSFFLGVFLYNNLSGDLPFTSDSIVELNEKVRRGYFVDLSLYNKRWKGQVAKTVSSCLKNKKLPNCDEWKDLFNQVKVIPTDDFVKDSSLLEKRKGSAKRDKGLLFLRKQSKTIMIGVMITVLCGVVVGSVLKSVFKPSPIKGLSSLEVVETFYGCFESLNGPLMRACVSRGRVAKKDLKVLSYISVSSKQKEAYSGDSGLLKASVWDKLGRPTVEPFVNLFGITDLQIVHISALEYQVEYLRWTTEHFGDLVINEKSATEDVSITGTKVKDTLYFKDNGDRFLITDIKRYEEIIYKEIVVWEEK